MCTSSLRLLRELGYTIDFLTHKKKTPKGLYSVLCFVYSRSLAKKKDEGDIKKEAVEI
jgi:hypothetical protein